MRKLQPKLANFIYFLFEAELPVMSQGEQWSCMAYKISTPISPFPNLPLIPHPTPPPQPTPHPSNHQPCPPTISPNSIPHPTPPSPFQPTPTPQITNPVPHTTISPNSTPHFTPLPYFPNSPLIHPIPTLNSPNPHL